MAPKASLKLADFPQLIAELHPELNKGNKTNLATISATARNKFWWVCNVHPDHIWEASILSRATNNVGCLICLGLIAHEGFNDLSTTHPELTTQWHRTKNTLKPTEVTERYSKPVWWECPQGHSYEMPLSERAKKNRNCSVCRGLKVIAGVNDFATTHPDIAKELHPTKNPDFDPTTVVAGKEMKVWWLGECGHEWFMAIDKRTSRGQGCSVCAGKVVITETSLASTHPDLAAQWHPTKNGDVVPSQVKAGTHQKAWWLGECGHEWDSVIKSRALSGHNCPYCAGKKIDVEFNSLSAKYPLVAAEWHPTKNGTVTPDDIVWGSRQMCWWMCSKGHEWSASAENRTRSNSGCAQCYAVTFVSKPELAIGDWLKSLGLNVQTTVYKLVKKSEIDIYLPDHKIAIEYNGLYWHSEARGKGQNYHYDKWKTLKEKGIQLIQIWEDDWLRNPELVKRLLAHKIGVSRERKVFARKTVVKTLTQLEVNSFLEEHHIQGAVAGGIKLGLFETTSNETIENKKPVAVMVLKKEPGTDGQTLNLLRYATSATVTGGFTKLLSYVKRTYTPETIITFSDNTISDGGLYASTGFQAVKELAPDYMYVVKGVRVHKFNYRLKRFRDDPALAYEADFTEKQLAALNNLTRIWDAGKTKWELAVK